MAQIWQYAERGTCSLTVVHPAMRHLKTVDSRYAATARTTRRLQNRARTIIGNISAAK